MSMLAKLICNEPIPLGPAPDLVLRTTLIDGVPVRTVFHRDVARGAAARKHYQEVRNAADQS